MALDGSLRVSTHYKLGKAQAELDFVDVDINGDTRVFISPSAIEQLPSAWGRQCSYLVQNFFEEVLSAIKSGKHQYAERLLRSLREPNETHLGLSADKPRGRALGPGSAHEIWKALKDSQAVRTGLLVDLEDTALMISGIGVDIVSDITTNIIREALIGYTQEACQYHGIPMESVASGPLWNPLKKQWESKFVDLPTVNSSKLLLVPKIIVRRHALYDAGYYLRHYLLEELKEVELSANSSLVRLIKKTKTKTVYKTHLIEKYGFSKDTLVTQTLAHPKVMKKFRAHVKANPVPPMSLDELAGASRSQRTDWDKLLKAVTRLKVGTADAPAYEKAVEGLLTALFWPSLVSPSVQHEIHNGRKRIDISYTNMGKGEFFDWVGRHYPAPNIFVECKNYGKEVGNPELDQLSGRFGISRGRVGLLVCRSVDKPKLLLERCKDTANDGRGFIIVLDDNDLRALVASAKNRLFTEDFSYLRDKFNKLVM